MNKKLNVRLMKSGSENDAITRLIANYNEGQYKAQISPRDLEGYLATRNGIFPVTCDLKLVKDELEPNVYHISEDGGKSFTMSLEWVEIFEIDDLKGVFEPQGNDEELPL